MNKNKIGIILPIVILLTLIITDKCSKDSTDIVINKTDTVFIEKIIIKEIKEKDKSTPKKTYIQNEKEAFERSKAESETIILESEVSKGRLSIVTIDTTGSVEKNEYAVSSSDSILIDNEGNVSIKVDKKKRRKEKINKVLKTIKNISIGIAIGIIVGSIK